LQGVSLRQQQFGSRWAANIAAKATGVDSSIGIQVLKK
jgi:hypothetical protein